MSSHGAGTRAQSQVVYAALVQGIVLVTFLAASTIFTSASSYGLSSSQYGAMFLPQAITAVGSSLLQGKLSQRLGGKPVYLAGLCANLAAMILLIASRFVIGSQPVAYPLLLLATACLGVGFGLTVPSINTFTAAFHPDTVDRSVLVLNSLLGLGTTLAPVFVAIFVGLGFWVGLPVLAAVAVTALLLASLRLPLSAGRVTAPHPATRRPALPPAFWLFAAFG
ncbi:MAG: MFS transporter [Streptosporangiaceae bacterium]